MKKIGIMTINDMSNYGNRLQNYAMQEIIKEYNFKPYSILIYNDFKALLKGVLKIYFYNFLWWRKRAKAFYTFSRKNIRYKYCINKDSLNKLDRIVVGSDQVWNYNFKSFNNYIFLPFSNKKNNFTYAASLGINTIDDSHIELFKKGLKNFKYISVREDSAKHIIENLIHRNDITVALDPTMLLDREKWEVICKKPKNFKNGKYILNYFLGELSKETSNEINRIAEENDCKIINILDKNSAFYNCGPSEFLYLEKNAFLICTDSFHSSVFSIIFDRPFLVFDRIGKHQNIGSRLDTLLSKFNLNNRKFSGVINKEDLKHDYTEAYMILNKEKEKSLKFLEKALDINVKRKSEL